MSHDFDYRVEGVALVPTFATFVRLDEASAGVRAELLDIAYRHGAHVARRHWQQARLMEMIVHFPTTSAVITATARQGFDDLLYGGIKTMTREDPALGEVQSSILTVEEVGQGENVTSRFIWPYSTWQLRGYWEEANEQTETDTGLTASGTIGPFTVGGNVRAEPKFTITCTADGSSPAIEHVPTGAKLTIVGSYVNTDVIVVDVANDLVTLNGTPAKNILRITRGYLMELDPGSVSLAFTSDSGTWTVDTEWRDRIR